MTFCSFNFEEGLKALRTLSEISEGLFAHVSVVDVDVCSVSSGILMDVSVVGDSEDDVSSVFSGLPMTESVVDYEAYDLEIYDSEDDIVLTDYQQEEMTQQPKVQETKRSAR